jgi:hypothetical protein
MTEKSQIPPGIGETKAHEVFSRVQMTEENMASPRIVPHTNVIPQGLVDAGRGGVNRTYGMQVEPPRSPDRAAVTSSGAGGEEGKTILICRLEVPEIFLK